MERLHIVDSIPESSLIKPDVSSWPIKPTFVVANWDGEIRGHALTPRKVEMIDLIIENPDIEICEIQEKMGLQAGTVYDHLRELCYEFGIDEKTQNKKKEIYKRLKDLQSIISGPLTDTERLMRSGTRVIYEGLRYKYPEKPKQVVVGNLLAFEYISPEEMDKNIRRMAENINLANYRAILVNLKGGDYLFKKLAAIKGYTKPPVYIEYHRPEEGFGAGINIRIPDHLIGTRCLLIEDLYYSGGVAEEITDLLSYDSLGVFIAKKDGFEGQLRVRGNFMFAVRLDPDVWMEGFGGCGMDLIKGPDGETTRNYGGIITKTPPLSG